MKRIYITTLIFSSVFGAFSYADDVSRIDLYKNVLNDVASVNRYVNYSKKDYKPMERFELGNCARFAATYKKRLNDMGIGAEIAVCVLTDGTGHAFTITEDDWILDVRHKDPKRWDDIGCKKY